MRILSISFLFLLISGPVLAQDSPAAIYLRYEKAYLEKDFKEMIRWLAPDAVLSQTLHVDGESDTQRMSSAQLLEMMRDSGRPSTFPRSSLDKVIITDASESGFCATTETKDGTVVDGKNYQERELRKACFVRNDMSYLVTFQSTDIFYTPTPLTGLAEQDEFSQLFAFTCMANVFTPEKLVETLSQPDTPQIAPDRADIFLRGNPGRVWELNYGKGKYTIAVLDSGLCSVFARVAQVDSVQSGFELLVSKAPSPLKSKKIKGPKAGPNDSDLTSTAFVWSRPGENLDIVFTLTTSKSAINPPVQAMASVALSKSEP